MRVTFSIARNGIGKRAKEEEEEEVHIFFVRTLFVIEFMEASIDEPLTDCFDSRADVGDQISMALITS